MKAAIITNLFKTGFAVVEYANEYAAYLHHNNLILDLCWWQLVPGVDSILNKCLGYAMTVISNRENIIYVIEKVKERRNS